jgi:NodT family efflux transporter outer membrane factor (OMF) lipoprotein
MRIALKASALLCAALLAGCSQMPAYQVPTVKVQQDAWKDIPWGTARPSDELPHGKWWEVFGDAALNELEAKLDRDSPNLAAALARYDQALSYTGQLRAGLYPSVDAAASVNRNRESDNRVLRGSNLPNLYDANTVGVGLNYELDLWGKVRSLVAAGEASLQAVAADLEGARLSLHVQLADNYMKLRGAEAQAKLLADTVAAYERALTLTQNRFAGGIDSEQDVERAKAAISTARAQAANVASARAVYEHAIASLVGVPAMSFTLPADERTINVPEIPAGLPSQLLERRPDVAAAERRTAAANAAIGVARAAYYPDFTLGIAYGYQNTGVAGNYKPGANYAGAGELLSAPNSFWSIGPGMVLNLFDAGLRDARVAQARAAHDEAEAQYRITALAAFQQVEDNLARLKYGREEESEQNKAADAAEKALALALNRYREGVASYLEVVTAQAASLSARRNALDAHTRQLQAGIDLVRALGGGWNAVQLSAK